MCSEHDVNRKTSLVEARVVANGREAKDHCRLVLEIPSGLIVRPAPGRFVMLRVSGESDPLLARPFGIAGFFPGKSSDGIEIFYRIAGRGTRAMATWPVGRRTRFLGPLGSGFRMPPEGSRSLLIAGGIGLPPLLALAREMASARRQGELTVLYGGRSLDFMVGLGVMEELGVEVVTCTEDGSCGRPGLVTGLLTGFDGGKGYHLFVCGPNRMMLEIHKLSFPLAESSQFSLESRMACGFGVCMGCAVSVAGRQGVEYRRVCCDGPVFDGTLLVPDSFPEAL